MKKVVIAMSGGIDSSMAALLLKKQGYDVIGVTMAVWDEKLVADESKIINSFQSGCFGPSEEEDISSAKDVCSRIGIEHFVVDMRKEYKNIVLDYFKDKYLEGVTPNPCVRCNKEIKFLLLPHKLKEQGVDFDYYATGHYVRLTKENGNIYIKKALDKTKDQSYFLCRLKKEQLIHLMFPLGELLKVDIKKMAGDLGFDSLLAKKESQDFIDSKDYGCIFTNKIFPKGKILDTNGNVLGEHQGIIFYTIGKRKGLNLSGLSEPYYVTAIDAEKNVIYAGPKSELYGSKLIAKDVIWIDGDNVGKNLNASAKIRLHCQQSECMIEYIDANRYLVVFNEEQMSITPEQIIAFYDGDRVLGGGIIEQQLD